jgi:4-hydroxy-tetrahydrodipicolinate synthase
MAVTKPIKGIIGACLTPFDDNDRVNYKALEKEIEFLITDCDGITIAAVEAAEYTMLSRDERKELLKVGTETVGKRVPVILGCSSPSARKSSKLSGRGIWKPPGFGRAAMRSFPANGRRTAFRR